MSKMYLDLGQQHELWQEYCHTEYFVYFPEWKAMNKDNYEFEEVK